MTLAFSSRDQFVGTFYYGMQQKSQQNMKGGDSPWKKNTCGVEFFYMSFPEKKAALKLQFNLADLATTIFFRATIHAIHTKL